MKTHSAWVPHMHTPAVQRLAVLLSQTIPHMPQLFTFVCVLMQAPVQQSVPVLQAWPQAPQFPAEVSVFTQLPPQHVRAPAHAGLEPHMQTPATQVSPIAHVGLQTAGATHAPPTQVSLPVHAAPAPQWQVPAMQVSPEAHAGEHITVAASWPPSTDIIMAASWPPSVGPGPVSGVVMPMSGASPPVSGV
jgi:hypothetical protein